MAEAQALRYIINHIFLPPKLPQKDNSGTDKDIALIVEFEAALKLFQAYVPSQEQRRWAACIRMLKGMLELRDPSGDLIPEKVEAALGSMTDQGMSLTSLRGYRAHLIVWQMFCPSIFVARMRALWSGNSKTRFVSSPSNCPQPPRLSWQRKED
jgi:hypothetical protein